MTDENDSVGVPNAFQSGHGFPTEETSEPTIVEESGYPYPYQVMEPESVTHHFPKPDEPENPRTREELERAVPQYVKYVLKEYDLALEYDRVQVKVDGRFRSALGKCGPRGYHESLVRISSHHYVERHYSWERCKETIRHELAHAWQARWLGYTSHGPTFRQKARDLDVGSLARYEDEREPKYVAHCQACGNSYTRHRKCKATKTPYNRCSKCETSGYQVDEIEEDHVWVVFDNTDWHTVLE